MIGIKIYYIKEVYSILDKLKLKLALDKTYIGNISDGKGFDFLGYHIRRSGVVISKTSFANMAVNISRLYEQHASSRTQGYLTNSRRWGKAQVGFKSCTVIRFNDIDARTLCI